MFEYEEDPVFQFMLYEFITEPEDDEDAPESIQINLEIDITYDPEDGLEEE